MCWGHSVPWGRHPLSSEYAFNGPKVVILSDKLFAPAFSQATPRFLAETVRLDDNNYTVIGVMARNFEDVLMPSAEIWTPKQYDVRQITSDFNTGKYG